MGRFITPPIMLTSITVLSAPLIELVTGEPINLYGPPRYRPDLLKKELENNPPPKWDLSERLNKVRAAQGVLAIDFETLHLYL